MSADPGERLDAVVAAFTALIADTEAQQRTMLRLSLEEDASERVPGLLRQGRAIGWIDEALEPLRTLMPEADRQRLILAVRSATGIERWLNENRSDRQTSPGSLTPCSARPEKR